MVGREQCSMVGNSLRTNGILDELDLAVVRYKSILLHMDGRRGYIVIRPLLALLCPCSNIVLNCCVHACSQNSLGVVMEHRCHRLDERYRRPTPSLDPKESESEHTYNPSVLNTRLTGQRCNKATGAVRLKSCSNSFQTRSFHSTASLKTLQRKTTW